MKYLLFKVYESGACNMWMSLEIAVGLAVMTDRVLVLYGSDGPGKLVAHVRGGRYKYTRPGFEGQVSYDEHPGIFDLLTDLPTATLDYKTLSENFDLNNPKLIHTTSHQLINCIFISKNDSEKIANQYKKVKVDDFSQGRTILEDPSNLIWHINGSTLSYYSRFFFNPPKKLYWAMEKIRPSACYTSLATKISMDLEEFNSAHIRLTDFKKFLPQNDNYPTKIASLLKSIFPQDTYLLIGTDESENIEFFKPINNFFSKVKFLDFWILENYSKEFRSLPYHDEQVLGLITNIVLWDSQDFAGTFGSTFTGIIHRNWKRKLANKPANKYQGNWRFTNSGYPIDDISIPGIFENGCFLDCQSGHYSWNRVKIPTDFGSASWLREWPESLTPDIPEE